MYKIGDKVIHQREGACHVKALTEMEMNKVVKEYYILEPLVDKKASIYISIDHNDQNRIRPVISRTQMKDYEETADTMEPDWIDDARKRYQTYHNTINSFDFMQVYLVFKSLMVRSQEKRLNATDEQLLSAAEKLVCSEISIVLDEEYSMVTDKIKQYICA